MSLTDEEIRNLVVNMSEEDREALRQDILDRYDNEEYWDIEIINR
jgi:hypothetical protein